MTVIYALRCPIANDIRYIGKTKNPNTRLAAHIKKAQLMQTDHHCARWIRQLLALGLAPTLEIVQTVQAGEDWREVEAHCIAEYRDAGNQLTNMTAGGDGFHDVHPDVLKKRGKATSAYLRLHKAEHTARMQEISRRPEVQAAKSASLRKAWTDPDKRKRLIDGARTPEAVKRKSAAMKSLNADPAYKAKQSATLKAIWSTPERRAEAKARVVAMHADPVTSARQADAIRAAYKNPEVKARLAAAMAEVNARPEVKSARAASLKRKMDDPSFRAKLQSEATRDKMSAKAKARWADDPIGMLASMNAPERTTKLSASMSKRNADPAFRAKLSDPEVRARAAATLRETWARRKAARQQAA